LISERESQLGIVAQRVFRDSAGRVVKTIYYRLRLDSTDPNGSYKKPYTEDRLVAAEILVHEYDASGHEVRVKHYSPSSVLSRTQEIAYDDAGKMGSTTWLRADGSREYQIRFREGRSVSHLYFDDTGKRLCAVHGQTPEEIDLAYGWGQSVGGLVCGIAPTKQNSPASEVDIAVTVKNLTDAEEKLATGLQYQTIQMELRDANGISIPPDIRYIEKRNGDLVRMNGRSKAVLQTVPPHEAWHVNTYPITEWYPDLKLGTYYLTVKCRADGEDFVLVSNTAPVHITAATTKTRTMP
jgi:hypothetical protein